MIHNVVVLTTSDDAVVQEVGPAGASADYVPDHDAVLAATEGYFRDTCKMST